MLRLLICNNYLRVIPHISYQRLKVIQWVGSMMISREVETLKK